MGRFPMIYTLEQLREAENPAKWQGTNLLGFSLSEARDRLLEEEA